MGSPVTHWQILSTDPARSASFYSELFDWKVDDDNPLGYRQVDPQSERGIPGGIWPTPPEAPSLVQLFVEVDDVDAYLERAQALGASVAFPPQDLPQGERMAVLVDPDGLAFSVHQPAG